MPTSGSIGAPSRAAFTPADTVTATENFRYDRHQYTGKEGVVFMDTGKTLVLFTGLVILCVLAAGCASESGVPPGPTPQESQQATKTRTPSATPTPIKETVYVYVTVTVTVTPTSAEPVLTKDPATAVDLPNYNAWRYQRTSKTDGITRYGPVYKLLLHLDKAPTKEQFAVYYQAGKLWVSELEGFIKEIEDTSPAIESIAFNRSIHRYTANLTNQNETIRSLDLLLTNWEFEEAWKVSRGIVYNISNATIVLDRQVSQLTG